MFQSIELPNSLIDDATDDDAFTFYASIFTAKPFFCLDLEAPYAISYIRVSSRQDVLYPNRFVNVHVRSTLYNYSFIRNHR